MPNIALLEADIAYLEAHPEEHNQRLWLSDCGTAFCLAGYRALKVAAVNGWEQDFLFSDQFVNPVDHANMGHAAEIAQEAYGLTEEQSDVLFYSENSIEDMKLMVKNLANGHEIWKGL